MQALVWHVELLDTANVKLIINKSNNTITYMTIAYMFLTYDNPILSDLWHKYLQHDSAKIYLHPKNKDLVSGKFCDNIIPETVKTEWGHISLVEATLLLLKYALKDSSNTHFVLLSGACMPVYPYDLLHRRIKKIKLSCFDIKQKVGNVSKLIECSVIKKKKVRKQSQWMILTRSDAEFFLQKNHVSQFSKMMLTDERYFITLLNCYERPYQNLATTLVLWPKYYSIDLPTIIRSQFPQEIIKTKFRSIASRLSSIKGVRQRNYILKRMRIPKHGHPITFKKIDNDTIKYAREKGSLFLRKVMDKTDIAPSVLTKLIGNP